MSAPLALRDLLDDVRAEAAGMSHAAAVSYLAAALEDVRVLMSTIADERAARTRALIAEAGSVRKAALVLGCSPNAVQRSAGRPS